MLLGYLLILVGAIGMFSIGAFLKFFYSRKIALIINIPFSILESILLLVYMTTISIGILIIALNQTI